MEQQKSYKNEKLSEVIEAPMMYAGSRNSFSRLLKKKYQKKYNPSMKIPNNQLTSFTVELSALYL